MVAAEAKRGDIVRMMLGFSSWDVPTLIEQVDLDGNSALYHAAFNGDAETARTHRSTPPW